MNAFPNTVNLLIAYHAELSNHAPPFLQARVQCPSPQRTGCTSLRIGCPPKIANLLSLLMYRSGMRKERKQEGQLLLPHH